MRGRGVLASVMLLLMLLMLLMLMLGSAQGAPPAEPERLNKLRLHAPASSLVGEFSLVLLDASLAGQGTATPSDVKGPFHLPPEDVPDGFP